MNNPTMNDLGAVAAIPAGSIVAMIDFECILRKPDGKLALICLPGDARLEMVARCNEGKATSADIDALADLAVFDMADVEHAPLTYR